MRKLNYLMFLPLLLVSLVGCKEPEGVYDGPFIVIESSQKTQTIEADATSAAVSFEAFADWVTEISEKGAEGVPAWFSIDPETGAEGENTITVTFDKNEEEKARVAMIKITSGGENYDVQITQKGAKGEDPDPDPAITIAANQKTQTINADVTTATVAFKTTAIWNASPVGASEWFSIDKTEGSAGDNTITVTFEVNEEEEARIAVIKIQCDGEEADVKITQKGAEGEDPGPDPLPYTKYVKSIKRELGPTNNKVWNFEYDKFGRVESIEYNIAITSYPDERGIYRFTYTQDEVSVVYESSANSQIAGSGTFKLNEDGYITDYAFEEKNGDEVLCDTKRTYAYENGYVSTIDYYMLEKKPEGVSTKEGDYAFTWEEGNNAQALFTPNVGGPQTFNLGYGELELINNPEVNFDFNILILNYYNEVLNDNGRLNGLLEGLGFIGKRSAYMVVNKATPHDFWGETNFEYESNENIITKIVAGSAEYNITYK